MPIQQLSDRVVAQIAAGEVVERPASVVKELVENALDAGAKNIHIAAKGGGRKLIQVSDDGTGILSSEIELAFSQHATSKLRTIDDLDSINTLGFRGEALSSIAAISRVSVTSRHRDEDTGTQLKFEGGQTIFSQSVGAPAGTVILVENLFYNTPARLKFLKKETTEKRQISSLITRYAMAYPEVRFILELDGREFFRSTGGGQLADVLVRTLGLENFKNMLEVDSEDVGRTDRPPIRVIGYTSTPDLHRADRSHISLFINGRWIQDSSLTYAIIQAYHTFLSSGRYPVSVLMITIPPQELDVNVHPTKAEVRFRDANAVFSAVQRAVRETIIGLTHPSNVRPERFQSYASSLGTGLRWGNLQTDEMQLDMGFPYADDNRGYIRPSQNPFEGDDNDDPTSIPVGIGTPQKPRTLPMLRVVGQVGATYIVAEGPAGMYLIDQNGAHQRILYEQFLEIYQGILAKSVYSLSASQTVDLTLSEMKLIEKCLDLLSQIGFEVDIFGANSYIFRAVPELVAEQNPVDIIAVLLEETRSTKDVDQRTISLALARIAAVKTGQILNQDEMQALIRQLERCPSPQTSPTGRATFIHLSGEQLAREFNRA
jgi:DNA mismatch repair protein MutL